MKTTINKEAAKQILRALMWSSGVFAAIMGILLAATLIQTRLHDPINSPALKTLIERVEKDPTNESLKEEIRAFDLLARKAYFTSVEQMRFGAMLFIAAVATFLLCWKLRESVDPTLPGVPGEIASWWTQQTRSRKAVAAGGISIFIILLLLGVFTKSSVTSGSGSGTEKQVTEKQTDANWCNFRGPDGVGIARFNNAPTSWDGAKMTGIKWKTPLDLQGNSSPVVWEDRIFVTGGSKERREVYCVNVKNGKLMWRYVVKVDADSIPIPKVIKETGLAAPTVACDGNRVYAIFATGELIGLTLDGKPVWTRYLGVPENHYGHASSLITHNGLLFVQFDQNESGKLYAMSGASGKTVWEVKRTLLSWASPICVNTGKHYELILADNEFVTSYNPSTGAVLWSQTCLYGEVGPSPAFSAGKVFAANVNAKAVGIDCTKSDSLGVPPIIWEYEDGELPNSPSPVALDSLLFLPSDDGTVTCLNTATGTEYWVEEFETGFYASPVISGNNVYFLDRKGVMQIVEASGTYKLIGTSSLGEPAVCTPAILDGFMIIRGEKHLFRIDGAK